jgi:rhodanese-related sulfurtransferase
VLASVHDVPLPEIDVNELAEHLRTGARLIDVREPDEYERGHVSGALSVPLATVPDQLDLFRGAQPTYVICQAGGRSRRACEYVEAHGIDAINVDGGTSAWVASGRETVSGDRPVR